MPFYDFEAIKASTDILQVAKDLGLELKKSGAGFRCACPTCKSDNQRGLVITQGKGYFCFTTMKGGDVLGLVSHLMDVGPKEAAGWLTEMYGIGTSKTVQYSKSQETGQSTVPPKQEARSQPPPSFDPATFAAKLTFTEEVAQLGFTETDAERFQIGFYRGKVYIPLRDPDGSVSGFMGWSEGQLKLPAKWLPPMGNVVPFTGKKSA